MSQVVSKYAYHLDLFFDMKIYSMFHVSLLTSIPCDPYSVHIFFTPSAVLVYNEKEYEEKENLDFKLVRKRLKYLVQYVSNAISRV